MSTQKPQPEIVQQFNDSFDYVDPFHKTLYHDDYDGDGWLAGNNTVALVDSDVSHVGDIDMDSFEQTEYVETQTLEYESDDGDTVKYRVYTFTNGEHTDYVNVEYVRTLANEVFNVSYEEIRSWAQTTDNPDSRVEGHGPVVFEQPDGEYRAVVLPVMGEPQ